LKIHLVDGTYELFRHYYALPSARDDEGREVAAVRGVLASVLGMIKAGVTHIAVATDHVIESFRNELWRGYKTGEGIETDLLAQFPLLEEVLAAAGVVVWPMVEFEADDALAAAAVAAPLQVFPPATTIKAPHFVDYVLTTLRQRYRISPGSGGGYRVVTSLDLTLQAKAEAAVTTQVSRAGNYYNFHDAALVSLDPQTGEILAMVGGANYNAPGGQINMATSPTRQVGSAFKIFTYSAALESKTVNMDSPILDAPLVFPIGGTNNGPTRRPTTTAAGTARSR